MSLAMCSSEYDSFDVSLMGLCTRLSAAPNLSGSGRVDMPTRPVAYSVSFCCNGSVGLKIDTCILYVEVWIYFCSSAGGLKKKRKHSVKVFGKSIRQKHSVGQDKGKRPNDEIRLRYSYYFLDQAYSCMVFTEQG